MFIYLALQWLYTSIEPKMRTTRSSISMMNAMTSSFTKWLRESHLSFSCASAVALLGRGMSSPSQISVTVCEKFARLTVRLQALWWPKLYVEVLVFQNSTIWSFSSILERFSNVYTHMVVVVPCEFSAAVLFTCIMKPSPVLSPGWGQLASSLGNGSGNAILTDSPLEILSKVSLLPGITQETININLPWDLYEGNGLLSLLIFLKEALSMHQ